MRNKRKRKQKYLISAALLLCMLVIGGTSAYYISQSSLNNIIRTEKNQVEFVEKFQPKETWLPGEVIEKKPYFKNTGASSILLRVRPEESWSKGDTIVDNADVQLVEKKWTVAWKSYWVEGEDGYFYYTKVLEEDEKTEMLLNSIILKTEASNMDNGIDYSDLDYTLEFKGESVIANEKAVPDSWGMTASIEEDTVIWTKR